MMSPENIPRPEPEPQNSGKRKTLNQQRPPEQPLKCPRCDSSNTKFCYYNNYSLNQPRYFCKTCRRYWTKGGALRNVPIGGGCRKSTKKTRSSSVGSAAAATTSRALSGDPNSKDLLKFLSPATPASPTVDFQLGGLSLPKLHPATPGVYTQFVAAGCGPGPGPSTLFGLDLLGLNYPVQGTTDHDNHGQLGTVVPISLSSIESLSSINQEMHWKLQQQRLAMIYGTPGSSAAAGDHVDDHDHYDDHHKGEGNPMINHQGKQQQQQQQGINLFQDLEINSSTNYNEEIISSGTRKFGVGPTEWFFSNGPSTNSSFNNNETSSESNLNGVQAAASWSDLHHQLNGLQ